jgi:hypothetical protein
VTIDAGTATPDVLGAAQGVTPMTPIRPQIPGAVTSDVEVPQDLTATRSLANAPSYYGVLGEQDIAFFLGQRGWNVVYGPGGSPGKSAFAKGIDYLGVKVPEAGRISLLILDNKASGIADPIDDCTAFTDNIKANLPALREKVGAAPDFANKQQVLEKLTELTDTIGGGGGYVDGVEFALSGAGGYARPATQRLQEQFFAATGLTTATGDPLQLTFIETVAPGELAARTAVLHSFGFNTRQATDVDVTEPVLVQPSQAALTALAERAGQRGEALVGAWMIIGAAIRLILSFIPTTADREFRRIEPTVAGQLNSDRALGGVLLICVWLVPAYSPEDLTDTAGGQHEVIYEFVRWEWQFGPAADDAYGWWAAPAKLDADHSQEFIPRHKEYWFWWFDRRTTQMYKPPRFH